MTTEQFDPYAIICTLAEVEWECPGDGVVPLPSYGITHALAHCTRCDDTGRIAPFASLRIEWQHGHTHQECTKGGLCLLTVISHLDIVDCEGRGWVSQPNVKKACWETAVVLEQQGEEVWWWYDYTYHTWGWFDGSELGVKAESAEEACLRGAAAYVRDKSYARSTERLP